MKESEIKKKEKQLIDFLETKIPDFVKMISSAVKSGKKSIIIHQDAFCADYQEDEYALLGKAIKSCGIFGIEIHITGANRSTIQGTRQDGYSKQLDYINKNYNTGECFTENQN